MGGETERPSVDVDNDDGQSNSHGKGEQHRTRLSPLHSCGHVFHTGVITVDKAAGRSKKTQVCYYSNRCMEKEMEKIHPSTMKYIEITKLTFLTYRPQQLCTVQTVTSTAQSKPSPTLYNPNHHQHCAIQTVTDTVQSKPSPTLYNPNHHQHCAIQTVTSTVQSRPSLYSEDHHQHFTINTIINTITNTVQSRPSPTLCSPDRHCTVQTITNTLQSTPSPTL